MDCSRVFGDRKDDCCALTAERRMSRTDRSGEGAFEELPMGLEENVVDGHHIPDKGYGRA